MNTFTQENTSDAANKNQKAFLVSFLALLWLWAIWQALLPYQPRTPRWEIVTVQDSNKDKVLVLLGQMDAAHQKWIDIKNCNIGDETLHISGLRLQDYNFYMDVKKVTNGVVESFTISDINLNGEAENQEHQSTYDQALNIWFQREFVEHCSE